jgi:hypothetical protein
MYDSTYEKPKPTNPFWIRVGQIVYLHGIECINPKKVEIGLYSTLKPITAEDFDLDAEFPFPEELLIQLKRQVLELGRFVLVIPEERINDGTDADQRPVPMNKMTSVNELTEDVIDNK